MKIHINKTNMDFKFIASDTDILAAKNIEKLMSEPGWSDLYMFFGEVRQAIEESLKDVLATDADAKRTQVKAAIFKGFDICADLPVTFIKEVAKLKPIEEGDDQNDPA